MVELYIWGECLSGGEHKKERGRRVKMYVCLFVRVCVCLCFVNSLTRFRAFNLFCHIQMMSN